MVYMCMFVCACVCVRACVCVCVCVCIVLLNISVCSIVYIWGYLRLIVRVGDFFLLLLAATSRLLAEV